MEFVLVTWNERKNNKNPRVKTKGNDLPEGWASMTWGDEFGKVYTHKRHV